MSMMYEIEKGNKMIYELKDTSLVTNLFDGWDETLILSCLQNVMGKIYVIDKEKPKSAMAYVGCFAFLAGEIDRELALYKPNGFVILTPQNEKWAQIIEECYPNAEKNIRFAIKKNTKFDTEYLKKIVNNVPDGYVLKKIDSEIYDECVKNPFSFDFVSSFDSKEEFLKLGRGFVILKDNKIVSGASSYSSYLGGIELEVDTVENERRKGLAKLVCAKLILSCIEEGLYPSWDAHNMISVHLAETLGYEFSHEYIVYEVS